MKNSIQTRLTFAFIGLAIGPLLLVGIVVARQSFTVQEQQALALQREKAERLSIELTGFIRETEGDLHLATHLQPFMSLGSVQQQAILIELMNRKSVFEELILLDESGREQFRLLSGNKFPSGSLIDRSLQAEFIIPHVRGITYIGPVMFRGTDQEPSMIMSIPIQADPDDDRTGVLVARVRFTKLRDVVAQLERQGNEEVYIVDNMGRVVAHRDPSVVLQETYFTPPPSDGTYTGLSGERSVLAIQPIEIGNQTFRIIAERPVSEAMALALDTVRFTGVVLVVALVVASALQYAVVHQIIRPIRELASTAREISEGNLTKRAVSKSRDEIGSLANAFNRMTDQLRNLIDTLEQRVQIRTRDLERRSIQLQVAAEVARDATASQELQELLDRAVHLIRERFGFYHAGIFMVNEETGYAVLQAATGEAGRAMLAAGHKLKVGEIGIVGSVTGNGEPRVVLNVGVDRVHFKNPYLPNTESEMALPLQVQDRVIGALDVQSEKPEAFDEEDVAILQTMADQLAIAIQNVQAYEQERQVADKLREVDHLKMQFIATMSHELRTPLNSIIGFSKVILKGLDGPITDRQQKDLTTIHSAGEHLLRLIEDILDISKIEAGKMELEMEETALPPIIDEASQMTSGLLADKPVTLEQEIEAEMPAIRADPKRIRQVLYNLLSNAAKFTETGEIRVKAYTDQDEVILSVSDTGEGIPEEKIPRLFEAFYQVDGSSSRRTGGTGLGLAITARFIEMHGGTISAESVVEAGSTFTVRLPINGHEPAGDEAVTGEKKPVASGK